jgi:alpha-galactosidase
MVMKRLAALLPLIGILSFSAAQAQKLDVLAQTPPMGWNSWNTFQTNISEQLVKDVADAIVASGMKDAGYTYIVLDDGWMAKQRDSAGNLVPDPVKFPHGIKALADYIHSKGLKFGLYNCAGTETCAGYPGTRGYEYQDARNYASWDVDYLKYDWCNTAGINAKEAYTTMSKALRKTGRPIVFSLCEWGSNKPWEWAAAVGQLWRTTADITPQFDGEKKHPTYSQFGILRIADAQQGLAPYAGPGHWNDPDMLEVGNGMSAAEDRSHFSLWCMMAAPLIAGNDLRHMSPATQAVLTNKALLSIDQDLLGAQGYKYKEQDSIQTWVKPLSGGAWAVCLVNRSSTARSIHLDWSSIHATDSTGVGVFTLAPASMTYALTDCWKGKPAGSTSQAAQWELAPHDAIVLKLTLH